MANFLVVCKENRGAFRPVQRMNMVSIHAYHKIHNQPMMQSAINEFNIIVNNKIQTYMSTILLTPDISTGVDDIRLYDMLTPWFQINPGFKAFTYLAPLSGTLVRTMTFISVLFHENRMEYLDEMKIRLKVYVEQRNNRGNTNLYPYLFNAMTLL